MSNQTLFLVLLVVSIAIFPGGRLDGITAVNSARLPIS